MTASVWTWLPDRSQPIRAGVIRQGEERRHLFKYDEKFISHGLEKPSNIAHLAPDLPLGDADIAPEEGMVIAGSLRDAAPDAWGRRVIRQRAGEDDELSEIDYLLAAGADRIGALDVLSDADEYRSGDLGEASLEELVAAVRAVESGNVGPTALDNRIGVGGARPKALVDLDGRKWIAKFSLQTDHQNVVKAEYATMRLAAESGLDVAPVRLERAAGTDVLLIERFDRVNVDGRWRRKGVVSALTMLGLDEMMARYASYGELCRVMTEHLVDPALSMLELFERLAFNVLCGNTDDHARNHAFLWDGCTLSLSPAYDVCPQARSGGEASQAMLIHEDDRSSRLVTCLNAAETFRLTKEEALAIMTRQVSVIGGKWRDVAEEAGLTIEDKVHLAHKAILNPFCVQGMSSEDLRDAYGDAAARID
ncbi:type II toxin-antitoxin system HipA family toxin [Rhizobium leguminosarum]|uniref:type II toxin-antitoxin system HipA family toxin n=1 Tax=Rhizobium leguminosarum TaxID=384 RepID=UPI002E141D30|nr:type II toxin-antitoxin system HipA family toxin [Rhizobium leguminosarum]